MMDRAVDEVDDRNDDGKQSNHDSDEVDVGDYCSYRPKVLLLLKMLSTNNNNRSISTMISNPKMTMLLVMVNGKN